MLGSVLNMIGACTAAAQVRCGSSGAGRRKGAFHSGRTLFGTLVDAVQGSDLPAPSWPFFLPLPIFPLTSKGNEVVRQGRAEDPVLISKDRRQSIEHHCSPSHAPALCSALLLPVPEEQILPLGSWRAPPRLQTRALNWMESRPPGDP